MRWAYAWPCTLRHSSWLPDYRDFFAALPDRTGLRGGWIERALREKWKLASGTATALVGLMVVAGGAGS